MAKRKVNKSESVRSYMAKNPKAGPSAVSEALGKQGVKVTPQQVSTIKANAKKKTSAKRKPAGGRKRAASKSSANGSFRVQDLLSAKDFAESVGGVEKAKSLLAALEELRG
ncbi:hypothetical protein KOR34_38020 [Posidoniimonas corsicana]|uniref:Uncharacterized protein n=1 Tax=Posidoniimonas corsicana TaxID=1938618 RepID=A0A5C5V606_9BACT|nr:hypothetical protein [Posidoniimonas corsicana]TWT33966.1 hypothetical protein KOR34_38020 [Posidoniimonas corsicana]